MCGRSSRSAATEKSLLVIAQLPLLVLLSATLVTILPAFGDASQIDQWSDADYDHDEEIPLDSFLSELVEAPAGRLVPRYAPIAEYDAFNTDEPFNRQYSDGGESDYDYTSPNEVSNGNAHGLSDRTMFEQEVMPDDALDHPYERANLGCIEPLMWMNPVYARINHLEQLFTTTAKPETTYPVTRKSGKLKFAGGLLLSAFLKHRDPIKVDEKFKELQEGLLEPESERRKQSSYRETTTQLPSAKLRFFPETNMDLGVEENDAAEETHPSSWERDQDQIESKKQPSALILANGRGLLGVNARKFGSVRPRNADEQPHSSKRMPHEEIDIIDGRGGRLPRMPVWDRFGFDSGTLQNEVIQEQFIDTYDTGDEFRRKRETRKSKKKSKKKLRKDKKKKKKKLNKKLQKKKASKNRHQAPGKGKKQNEKQKKKKIVKMLILPG